jgi:hypothetical protein
VLDTKYNRKYNVLFIIIGMSRAKLLSTAKIKLLIVEKYSEQRNDLF